MGLTICCWSVAKTLSAPSIAAPARGSGSGSGSEWSAHRTQPWPCTSMLSDNTRRSLAHKPGALSHTSPALAHARTRRPHARLAAHYGWCCQHRRRGFTGGGRQGTDGRHARAAAEVEHARAGERRMLALLSGRGGGPRQLPRQRVAHNGALMSVRPVHTV